MGHPPVPPAPLIQRAVAPTLAVHSMLGYAGGFVGPLARSRFHNKRNVGRPAPIGWTLDAADGMSPVAFDSTKTNDE